MHDRGRFMLPLRGAGVPLHIQVARRSAVRRRGLGARISEVTPSGIAGRKRPVASRRSMSALGQLLTTSRLLIDADRRLFRAAIAQASRHTAPIQPQVAFHHAGNAGAVDLGNGRIQSNRTFCALEAGVARSQAQSRMKRICSFMLFESGTSVRARARMCSVVKGR